MKTKTNTSRRLTASIVAVVALAICFCITTFALIYASVTVENNIFSTGLVKINLNDGKPVIEEGEFLFEPGMTVKKDFFLENLSSDAVYYRLYFDDVEGGLADVLEITIAEGDKVLYTGNANDLSKENVSAADTPMEIGERKDLTVWFHFPETAGNSKMDLSLSFDICADAVQTRNNPDHLFD